MTANPAISVNLPSDEVAIILEGEVERIADSKHPLADPQAAASRAKYPQYVREGEPARFHALLGTAPRIVYAWTLTNFPNRATRWTFV